MSSVPLRVALIGWGAIGQTVVSKLNLERTELVAVGVRNASIERPNVPSSARLIDNPADLASTAPDLVVEAAGRDSVGPWARASLSAGLEFVVSSVAALADAELFAELERLATANRTQLVIQPGALAGIDALAAARHMGIDEVVHRIVKPPAAWRDTLAEQLCSLDELSEPTEFYAASAPETAAAFPKNANVAMTTALAGVGVEHTTITLIADPSASTNRHEIRAHGAFGALDVAIANNPLPANAKTSAMAALALVRLIENRTGAIVI